MIIWFVGSFHMGNWNFEFSGPSSIKGHRIVSIHSRLQYNYRNTVLIHIYQGLLDLQNRVGPHCVY